MSWVVYMIRCGDGSLYTGATNNLLRRLKQHQSGEGAKFTRGRGFLTLAWNAKVANVSAALKLEAIIKKLSKKKKEALVRGSNPLLEAFLEACSQDLGVSETIELRDRLVFQYSWAVPTEEALRHIAALSPIVEMGAGTGYWASLLREMGASVQAYDRAPPGSLESLVSACNPWHIGSKQHTEVLQGTPEILESYADKTLLLCWPPRGSMAFQCLEHWKGKRLVYVGEFSDTNADEKFREALCKDFVLEAMVPIPQWPGASDSMSVWRRP